MCVCLKISVKNFDMEKIKNNIDFLILGSLGQMGRAAQNSLPGVIKNLEKQDLYIRSVNLIDPRYQNIEKQADTVFEDSIIPVRKFSSLSDVMYLLLESGSILNARLFIYDASPTPYHFGHLSLVTKYFSKDVCYFGEKPIFTKQEQLSILQNVNPTQVYCNFSETMSEVSKKLVTELDGQNIISTHIARISSVSKKKAYGIDRNGVTGGALFDKGVHALAFTLNIIGVDKVNNYEITNSNVESLCVNEKNTQPITYLDSMNRWDKKKISCELNPFDWSVDGAISASMKWHVLDDKKNMKDINSKYYFSWVGVKQTNGFMEFQKYMTGLGFNDKEWRLDVDLSKKAEVNLIDEHVRCSIIETEEYFYVCNFLSSPNPENDAAIWKIEKGSTIRKRIFPVDDADGSVFNKVREGKTNNAIVNSILSWYGISSASNLDQPMTVMAHDVLLKLRDTAYGVLK